MVKFKGLAPTAEEALGAITELSQMVKKNASELVTPMSKSPKNSPAVKKASSEKTEALATTQEVTVVLPAFPKQGHGAIYPKYTVVKNETGEVLTDDVFVLRPARDRAAWLALYEYARACAHDDPQLSQEIYGWLGAIAHP